MYILKAFASHTLFTNNTKGVVDIIGEISTQSLTYAREKGLYKSSLSNDISITTFTSNIDGAYVVINTDIIDHVVTISKFIYDKIIALQGPVYADELLKSLFEAFPTVADSFECGPIIDNGSYYIPEWVSWNNNSILPIKNNILKVWFSDQSFLTEYDDYEIIPIPPITSLDDFFKSGADVEKMIAALSPATSMDTIQIAKNGYPESIVRTDIYNYVDPLNPAHTVVTAWSVLIYGQAGNNPDAISDVLTQYILDNSTHSRAEWTLLFPDLFKRTEFILLPDWDLYAIPNRTLEAGIYSPIANLTDSLSRIQTVSPLYSAQHTLAYASIMGHPYKSLSILSIGSPDNRDSIFRLTDTFQDYISVSSTSIDFNRMSQTTQGWMTVLSTMLIVAESMDEYTSLAVGFTKLKRNNILYLVKRYGNINYLIVAKKNFPLPLTNIAVV